MAAVAASASSAASAGVDVLRPVLLEEGDAPEEIFDVMAASVWRRAYRLEGAERISWRLKVQDSYDIVFCSKVSCSGLQVGMDRCRDITERERGEEFDGYLDLSKDHAGWLQALGAAPSAAASSSDSGAVLMLELDNYYSYFTPKRVALTISKQRPAALKPKSFAEVLEACEPSTRFEHALKLLGRMRDLKVEPDLHTYNAALAVCRDSRRWEEALKLLEDMRVAGVEPDAESLGLATSACELCGQADKALELLDQLDSTLMGGGHAASNRTKVTAGDIGIASGSGGEDEDVSFMRITLREAIARCPSEARDVLGHLLSAQESLEKFASKAPVASHNGGYPLTKQ